MLSSRLQEKTTLFQFGLFFPQQKGTTATVRDIIETLLGPRPDMSACESGWSGDWNDIASQRSALIAYRAKLVALIDMLEGGVQATRNEQIARAPRSRMCVLRKPIAAARLTTTRKEKVA